MGRYGRKEVKNRGKVQINFEITFVCYVEMIICWVLLRLFFEKCYWLREEHWLFNPHSSTTNLQCLFPISVIACQALTRARASYRDFAFFAVTSVTQSFFSLVFLTFKWAVVLAKTTRCFSENHTLFWWKQHVVLVKMSRRLLLDSAHFATSWAKMCNECYNMGLTNLRTEAYVTTCDTCDSKKCKIPVGCARAHAWEGVI